MKKQKYNVIATAELLTNGGCIRHVIEVEVLAESAEDAKVLAEGRICAEYVERLHGTLAHANIKADMAMPMDGPGSI